MVTHVKCRHIRLVWLLLPMIFLDVLLEWLLPMILEVLFPKRPTFEVPTIILLNLIINPLPLPILDDKGPDDILNMLADTITDKHVHFSPCSNICGHSGGDGFMTSKNSGIDYNEGIFFSTEDFQWITFETSRSGIVDGTQV